MTPSSADPAGEVVRDAHPVAALHLGAVTEAGITWRSSVALPLADVATHAPLRLALGVPLEGGSRVDPRPGIRPVVVAGRTVAFEVDPSAIDGRMVSWVTHQGPVSLHGGVRLEAPLLVDAVPQIVGVAGEQGVRFEPRPSSGLERHVGFYAPPGLPGAARDQALGLFAGGEGPGLQGRGGDLVYLRMNGALAAQGLEGTLSTASDRARVGTLGALGAFALVVGLLVVAFRKLARAARAEEAEAFLRAEFDHLSDEAPRDEEGARNVPADPRA